MGDALVGDVASGAAGAGRAGRGVRPARSRSAAPAAPAGGPRPDERLGRRWPCSPRCGRTAGSRSQRRHRAPGACATGLRLSEPGSYYQSGSGGLGFAISAAVGVQLAKPERPVVCVVGEGSAQYGITALWTAAAYKVPVTFLVLRNQEYMILKWFAAFEKVEGAPGLELPDLDTAAVASAYGVPSPSRIGARRAGARRCARRSPPTTVRAWCRPGSRPGCGSSSRPRAAARCAVSPGGRMR